VIDARATAGDPAATPSRTGTAGTYTIDTTRTSLTVRSRWLGLPVTSTVWGLTGVLEVPDELRETRLRTMIGPGAVIAGGPWRWMRSRPAGRTGGAMAGATFTADALLPILDSYTTPDGDRPLWALDGDLTLQGRSRRARVALCVLRPAADGSRVEFEATVSVQPADFGLPGGGPVHVRIVGVAVAD
jgi:polyisoprenoid-binding protein YceI